MVIDANKSVNLTSITNINDAKILHIEDSLITSGIIKKIDIGDLVDLGSGSGYPGIPLAVVSKRKTYLIETVKKKAKLLTQFINMLGLNNQVIILNDRIENISLIYKNQFKKWNLLVS